VRGSKPSPCISYVCKASRLKRGKLHKVVHENIFWHLRPTRYFHPTKDSRAIKHKTLNSNQNSKFKVINFVAFKSSCYSIFFVLSNSHFILSFRILVLDVGVLNSAFQQLQNSHLTKCNWILVRNSSLFVTFFQTCFWLLISFEWLLGPGGN